MKLRNKIWTKAVLAALFFSFAMLCTMLIRDALSLKAPKNALPEMGVTHNNVHLPSDHIYMSSYSWRFLFKPFQGTAENPEAWRDAEPSWIAPGAQLIFSFTQPTQDVLIWFSSDEEAPDSSFEVLSNKLDDIYAPTVTGEYTYKIWGGWGAQGSVLYYLKIQIP